MRLREWYGYHFPELTQIITDNLVYARVVKKLGIRTNTDTIELDDLVGEEVSADIKQKSEISMGTNINKNDVGFIINLADQIIELFEYRSSLEEYLTNRMLVVAPNLSAVVGEMIAAKLIAKAGSLINLAKCSASTI